MIIDAENAIVGRLASFVAKQALLGKIIIIVNSEKAIISGNRKNILEKYLRKRRLGGTSLKAEFPSQPEKILKRIIRAMLSYKQKRGKDAFKRIKCYISVPSKFEKEKMIKAGRGGKGITLAELSELLK